MDALQAGRDAFARRAWDEAFTRLTEADQRQPLAAADLELLAICCGLLARDDDADAAWERAHHGYLDEGNHARAARAAFWLGMHHMQMGAHARGAGWFGRAHRLIEEHEPEGPERGLLMIPMGLQTMMSGDPSAAEAIFAEAHAVGERFKDPDLLALAMLGRGQCLIRAGDIAAGVAFHDEVMIAVTAPGVSPPAVGICYCAAVLSCYSIFDIRRAREWTAALDRWCATQPALVPFRGQCLVHRSQIMQISGAWREALDEAEHACEWLTSPPQDAAGLAFYQLGELHRVRGEIAAAEQAYGKASERGHSPQPGLALLRLQQGQTQAAEATMRRLIEETSDATARDRLLPAHVEVMLAVGDLDSARATADELIALSKRTPMPYLEGVAQHALGHVLLAKDDPRGAHDALRRAAAAWQQIDAVHEGARTRVLIARACEALGDSDSAAMEREAAKRVFRSLGAEPDLASLDEGAGSQPPGGLTARELDVLRLVAGGKTNRAIAADLFISEKTVARHVSNILLKLGLPSRAAATAYAYEQNLVQARPT